MYVRTRKLHTSVSLCCRTNFYNLVHVLAIIMHIQGFLLISNLISEFADVWFSAMGSEK